jgi:hypothetical protein
MFSSVSEALTLVLVLLAISTKLFLIKEFALSLMTRTFKEVTKSHHHLLKPMIFIPVFSINYAASSFCLDELVHIIHCFKEKNGRKILPVFYDVDPSHVRHQKGSYGEALAKHEEMFKNNKEKYIGYTERLHKWKMALYQTANLSGHHFTHGYSTPLNSYFDL